MKFRTISLVFSLTLINMACGDKRVLEPEPVEVVKTYSIGDSHEGGTIFYVDSTGKHGFIAKAGDESPSVSSLYIPDPGTVTSTINVTGVSGTVGSQLQSVCLSITHPYDADLDISLRAPNGATIDLCSDNGGSSDNFINTCFVPFGTSIISGSAPFTGNYSPEQPFSNLSASTANGIWTLIITDDGTGDVGYLKNWSIVFSNAAFIYPSFGSKWNNGSNITTSAYGLSKGTGASNTALIVSAQGPGSYAASVCDALSTGGYSDWHLPSLNELTLLYAQKSVVGAFSGSLYWTSSEISSSNAYIVNFSNGTSTSNLKSNYAIVRAVRAF